MFCFHLTLLPWLSICWNKYSISLYFTCSHSHYAHACVYTYMRTRSLHSISQFCIYFWPHAISYGPSASSARGIVHSGCSFDFALYVHALSLWLPQLFIRETAAVFLSVVLTLQDLIDSDELLDPEDLKKPDPASLKAPSCGEGKKRKACKNWWVLGAGLGCSFFSSGHLFLCLFSWERVFLWDVRYIEN